MSSSSPKYAYVYKNTHIYTYIFLSIKISGRFRFYNGEEGVARSAFNGRCFIVNAGHHVVSYKSHGRTPEEERYIEWYIKREITHRDATEVVFLLSRKK